MAICQLLAVLCIARAANALQPAAAPLFHTRHAARSCIPRSSGDPPLAPREEGLLSLAEISETLRETCEYALRKRNAERKLAGQPEYESLEAMVDAYMEYEGRELGYSRAKCESEVVRFLQRRALLEEGYASWKDPQTVATFLLLAIIVVGLASQLPTLLGQM
ncbi:hypothetical protein AB1Y20_023449 [Prymnesium parvum]|uniref:Uncharacterized protein n=1 Tax=Prymnesium parvum TaxID=97485 RepID=A0AB34JEN8_PRYPA